MRYVKCMQTGLDITNYIAFSADPNAVMNELRQRFKGKCYKGVYIMDIVRVVREGNLVVNQQGSPTVATMSVMFEADIITYAAGDVIVGLQLKQTLSNGCSFYFNDYIAAMVEPAAVVASPMSTAAITNTTTNPYASLNPGCKVILNIISVESMNFHDRLGISAAPFTFPTTVIAYKCYGSGAINKQQLLGELETAGDIFKTANPQGLTVYRSLMYAYAAKQPQPANSEVVSLEQLVNQGDILEGTIIARDPRMDLYSPEVLVYPPGSILPANYVVREVAAELAIVSAVEDYRNKVHVIEQMLDAFPADKFAENKNMFIIIKNAKLPSPPS